MKKWSWILVGLALVGCGDGKTEEEAFEKTARTENVEVEKTEGLQNPVEAKLLSAVEDVEHTVENLPVPLNHPELGEPQLPEDEVHGYLYLIKIDGSYSVYTQLNRTFNKLKGYPVNEQNVRLIESVQRQQKTLMGPEYSVSLGDKEYEKELKNYHQSLLDTYEALGNAASAVSQYSKGEISEEEAVSAYEVYRATAGELATIRNSLVDAHNSKYGEQE